MSNKHDSTIYGFGYTLSKWIVDRPILSIALGLLIFAASGVPFIITGKRATEIAETGKTEIDYPIIKDNFTHTAFFTKDDPLLQRFDTFEQRFGNDDAIVVVVHHPEGVFDLKGAQLIREITEEMWQVHDVIRVDSLSNFQWVHAEGDEILIDPLLPKNEPLSESLVAERKKIALEHETIPNYLVTPDAKTAFIYARIKPALEKPADSARITNETRDLVKGFHEAQGAEYTFHITGGPAINFSFQDSAMSDQSRLNPILFGIIILFLIAMFRRVGGVFLPLLIIMLSVGTAFAFMGWYAVEVGTITIIAIQIMLSIAIADSVHVLSTYYMSYNEGLDRKDAVLYALSKNALPTFLTSASTALGFFSFFTANLKPVLGLGLIAGTATLLAWLYTYLILGGLITLLPAKDRRASKKSPELDKPAPWAITLTDWLYSNRIPIFGATTLLLIGSIALTLQVRVNSNPFEYFRTGVPIRDAQDFALEHTNGVANFEIMVDSGSPDGIKNPEFLKSVEKLENQILEIEGVAKAVSIIDIIRQTHRTMMGEDDAFYSIPSSTEAVGQLLLIYENGLPQGMDVNDRMTQNKQSLRITLVSNITDSEHWVETTNHIEAMGADLGLSALVTGKNYLYQNMNGYVVNSFRASLSIAVLLISLLMIGVFRSFKLGLIGMIPNLVPLLLGGAILKLMGADLDIGTVLVASVCLGIAVDDTIHVLSNFNRYQAQGMSPKESIALVISRTAPALVVTSSVLVGGFGVLVFGTFVPTMYFGILVSTILLVALVVDLTFLPALLMTWSDNKVSSSNSVPALATS